jgi:hypothetical protein
MERQKELDEHFREVRQRVYGSGHGQTAVESRTVLCSGISVPVD